MRRCSCKTTLLARTANTAYSQKCAPLRTGKLKAEIAAACCCASIEAKPGMKAVMECEMAPSLICCDAVPLFADMLKMNTHQAAASRMLAAALNSCLLSAGTTALVLQDLACGIEERELLEREDVGALHGIALSEHGHLAHDVSAGTLNQLAHGLKRLAGGDNVVDD